MTIEKLFVFGELKIENLRKKQRGLAYDMANVVKYSDFYNEAIEKINEIIDEIKSNKLEAEKPIGECYIKAIRAYVGIKKFNKLLFGDLSKQMIWQEFNKSDIQENREFEVKMWGCWISKNNIIFYDDVWYSQRKIIEETNKNEQKTD